MNDALRKHIRRPLYWLAGTSEEEVNELPPSARLQCQCLGIVMLANYLLLLAIWGKVGWRYFGAVGLVVPGLVLPTLMALGLDRLILMQSRPYRGVLAPATPAGVVPARRESGARVVMAVLFSAFTTASFMVELSAPSIAAFHARESTRHNQPLMTELRTQADTERGLVEGVRSEAAELRAQRKALDERLAKIADERTEAAQNRDRANQEAVREDTGVGNRAAGRKEKWRGQKELEAANQRIVERYDSEAAALTAQRQQLDGRIDTLSAQVQAADTAHAASLASLDARLRADPRYDPPRGGLFADFTAWVRLFSDPDEGLGRWVLTLLAWPVLVGLESAILLAVALGPCSILYLKRDAALRQLAAETIAASEARVAAANLRHAGVHVRHADARHRPRDPHAPPPVPPNVH